MVTSVGRPSVVAQVATVVGNGLLTDLVQVGDKLVELGISVVSREPDRLAVVRVVAPAEGIVVLLLTFVDDRNAVRQHRVGDDVPSECHVTVERGEARLVVVLTERSNQRHVGAFGLDRVDRVCKTRDGAAGALESIDKREVLAIVHDTRHVVLVVADVLGTFSVSLADHVDTGSFLEACPEASFDLDDSVQAQAVDAILRNKTVDPVLVALADVVVFSAEVRERHLLVADPASVNVFEVIQVAIIDWAVGSVVLRLVVERVEG